MLIAGVAQIGQLEVKEFVTEADSPPMIVVSRPVAVTVLETPPAQVSATEGRKLLVNTA